MSSYRWQSLPKRVSSRSGPQITRYFINPSGVFPKRAQVASTQLGFGLVTFSKFLSPAFAVQHHGVLPFAPAHHVVRGVNCHPDQREPTKSPRRLECIL